MLGRCVGVGLLCLGVAGCCSATAENNRYGVSAKFKRVKGNERAVLLPKRKISIKAPVIKVEIKKVRVQKIKVSKAGAGVVAKRLANKEHLSQKPALKISKQKADKAEALILLRTVDGVSLPQSVLFDQKRLRFYVSRLGDKPEAQSGAIALLARDGSVINASFVKGLDQPRGMALVGKHLYVADGKSLVVIDIDKAIVVHKFEERHVFYFNDVVADAQGRVYVSAPLNNGIFVLSKGKFNDSHPGLEPWLNSGVLSGPNGLSIADGDLFVASIGLNKSNDGQVVGGALFRVSLADKQIKKLTSNSLPPIASLSSDGEGHVYATDDGGAKLFKFELGGRLLEEIDVAQAFKLKEASGLGDFQYMKRSKEFWVPVKSNGHILVFGRSDARLSFEEAGNLGHAK